MATAQHYVWAGGHFLLLVCASRYLLAWLTFRSSGQSKLYFLSYFGALVSYAIVCYKSFGQGPQPAGSTLRRAMIDENVQYFILALFWWMSKPVPVSLIPFATFSLFHVLTFLRTYVLPHFFPPTPSVTAGQPAAQHPFLKKVHGWVKANYDPAMKLVAYAELLILVRVVLGAVTFQNSLLSPIIYAHFLRLRFYQFQFTQRAVAHVTSLIDGFVRKQGNPPILVSIWEKAQLLVAGWASFILVPQQPAAAGPGRR
ncbi:hypothetical protein EW145_g425 [Phellinidium pouzarii]|uniref:Endoplasmic reticulum protein n=1 Tax=Phellinidium pouzarii TaxID=167371 RepID=A0A4S4LIE1_9AGAM|nr:hypothetical protein EW145_g425 [Phellinidium pouzarii]